MVHTDTLVIEVTRRCNYRCMHCLRGDAQDKDISKKILDRIVESVIANNVVFTGGEPALNIKAISYYWEQSKKHGTLPSSFYIVTNGSVNQEKLALVSLRMYAQAEEKELCGLSVSSDPYHGYPEEGAGILEGLAFLREDKTISMDIDDEKWIIKTGRARENGMEGRINSFPVTWDDITADEIWENDGHWYLGDILLYVSCNGQVTFDCDMSYEEIDNTQLGTIFDLEKNLGEKVTNR